jgi:hypothetical protein
MERKLEIKIGLKDRSYLTCIKDYNYFERAILMEKYEKAKDEDIIIFENGIGADVLVPKKNILFIQVITVECIEDKEGGETNGEIYRDNKVRSGED